MIKISLSSFAGCTFLTLLPNTALSSPTTIPWSDRLRRQTGSSFHPGWTGRSKTSWSYWKLILIEEQKTNPLMPSLGRSACSIIFKCWKILKLYSKISLKQTRPYSKLVLCFEQATILRTLNLVVIFLSKWFNHQVKPNCKSFLKAQI